jgi:hypothetical protein
MQYRRGRSNRTAASGGERDNVRPRAPGVSWSSSQPRPHWHCPASRLHATHPDCRNRLDAAAALPTRQPQRARLGFTRMKGEPDVKGCSGVRANPKSAGRGAQSSVSEVASVELRFTLEGRRCQWGRCRCDECTGGTEITRRRRTRATLRGIAPRSPCQARSSVSASLTRARHPRGGSRVRGRMLIHIDRCG